jgi:hypothetical protein
MLVRQLVIVTVGLASMAVASVAADLDPVAGSEKYSSCGPNGYVEVHGGISDMRDENLSGIIAGDASLGTCFGRMFGVQLDAKAEHQFSEIGANALVHGFVRDPDNYLFGAIAGYGDFGPTNAWYFGPELEIYGEQISLEAVGGYMKVSKGPREGDQLFALADVAFYPTENLRLVAGASSVAKFESAHLGVEWMLEKTDLPLSFKLDGRVGENGYVQAMAGVTLYFGSQGKSLIHRHREDIVRNRALDINMAAGGATGFGVGEPVAATNPPPGSGNPPPGSGNPPPGSGNPPPNVGNPPPEENPTIEELKNAIGTECSDTLFNKLIELVGPNRIFRDDGGICRDSAET